MNVILKHKNVADLFNYFVNLQETLCNISKVIEDKIEHIFTAVEYVNKNNSSILENTVIKDINQYAWTTKLLRDNNIVKITNTVHYVVPFNPIIVINGIYAMPVVIISVIYQPSCSATFLTQYYQITYNYTQELKKIGYFNRVYETIIKPDITPIEKKLSTFLPSNINLIKTSMKLEKHLYNTPRAFIHSHQVLSNKLFSVYKQLREILIDMARENSKHIPKNALVLFKQIYEKYLESTQESYQRIPDITFPVTRWNINEVVYLTYSYDQFESIEEIPPISASETEYVDCYHHTRKTIYSFYLNVPISYILIE
jgi:hypothetical protein